MNEPKKTILPILFALIVAIFPHIPRLPLWIVVWCGAMWGYLVLSFRFRWPRPGRTLRRVLTVVGIAGLLLTFTRRLDQDAYVGLLAVMAALKPFEMETHRDRMITAFLAYFIVITSLFLSETLAITLYMLISVGVTTAVLARINNPLGNFRADFSLSIRILAQAVPLMVLLFFLFPRIEGSLFGMWLSNTARSGFSDRLAPGGVALLVESEAVAFRATFEKRLPPPELRYWRGIVFENFDGRGWEARPYVRETGRMPEGEDPVTCTISMEPHRYRWLFALEMPVKAPSQASWFADYTLRTQRPVYRKMRYEVTSFTNYRTGPEDKETLNICRRLPDEVNPRARDMASRLTGDAVTDMEKAQRILAFFRTGGFVYTLEPPRLGRHSVDDFIFESRRGYCEHFASAFCFMLRAAGVPARIVGGYQGGEVNPFANYLIVRQADAHVWVEIWTEDAGWTRLDPTAVVVPERISLGMRAALDAGAGPGMFSRGALGTISGWFKNARQGWEALNTKWAAFFEGYSYDVQQALLAKLGIRSGTIAASVKALLILVVLCFAIVGLYVWFASRPPGEKPDDVKKYYARFCEKLARAGLARPLDQGPVDFMKSVVKQRPDLEKPVSDITARYVRLRYEDAPSKALISEFIKKVREFKPLSTE